MAILQKSLKVLPNIFSLIRCSVENNRIICPTNLLISKMSHIPAIYTSKLFQKSFNTARFYFRIIECNPVTFTLQSVQSSNESSSNLNMIFNSYKKQYSNHYSSFIIYAYIRICLRLNPTVLENFDALKYPWIILNNP